MKTNRMTKIAVVSALGLGLTLTGCTDPEHGTQSTSESQGPTEEEEPPAPTEAQGEEKPEKPEGSGSAADSGTPLPADADLSKETPEISGNDAVDIAKAKVGGDDGIVHAIELDFDTEDGKWEYDVKIKDDKTDHKVVINASSGKVIRQETDDSDDTEKDVNLASPMTFDQALDLAQKKGKGRLAGWKLEYDDGQRQYQFDFDDDGTETEVTVNVESKQVTVD